VKKFVILLFTILTFSAISINAEEVDALLNNSVNLKINGVNFVPKDDNSEDLIPITYNDITYLPVRVLAEALGAEVSYDNNTKLVTITSGKAKIPNESFKQYNNTKSEIKVKQNNSATINVDGKDITVDELLYQDRAYLPLRTLADSLECTTDYDKQTKTIIITNNRLSFPQLCETTENEKTAVIETNKGKIKVKLFPEYAPKAVENFIKLSQQDYYNGVIFHRVINNFVIQAGDPTGTGAGGESIWKEPFENEVTPLLRNIRGALCMANSGKDTNQSQFYIVQNKNLDSNIRNQLDYFIENQDKYVEDTQITISQLYPKEIIQEYIKNGGLPYLDYDYTVFGQVLEGMNIVDEIASVETNSSDKPIEDIVINKIIIN